jgi:predicted AlkP superfamily pyrophosphatase or phosphodiesterase
MRRPYCLALAAVLAAQAPALADAPPPPPAPRLILFLVVDQGRADYFEKYRPLFRFGLARLLDESVRFTRTFHDHAIPKTAPGHATLISGTYPSRHGIIANDWYERASGDEVGSIDDPVDGVSPRRLLVSTLGDWLKSATPNSKVYAVSEKDRSAALLAGPRGDGAFWLDEDRGRISGSPYFADFDPTTLGLAADRLTIDSYFGRLWQPLDAALLESLPGLVPMERGYLAREFPHSFGDATLAPDEDYYETAADSPWIDEMTIDLAEAVLRSRELGDDGDVDLLGVSLSAVDAIGHHYGPESPELVDILLRLDRLLGRLLDTVELEVGLERTIVSLSADHGVTPVPGALAARGLSGRRLYGEEVACFQRATATLVARFGEAARARPGPFFDDAAIARSGHKRVEIESAAAELLEACPRVENVWTRSELSLPAGEDATRERVLFDHAFHLERSPDLLVQLEPHAIAWTSWETTHSSVYEYDRHVPWLLRIPGVAARVEEREVATADVAPTLAALVGASPAAEIDGVSRAEWLTSPAPNR